MTNEEKNMLLYAYLQDVEKIDARKNARSGQEFHDRRVNSAYQSNLM